MPETGRFTGKDPFKGDGLNLYVYVKSNPMRFVDPSGFCAAEGQMQDDYGNNYLLISIKQVVMGNYTEDVSALGTAGQIGIAIIGLDAPMDARDLVYDLTNWEWSWGHAGQTLIDIIAFVPVIGALKYADESAILIKQADLAKYVKNSEKTGDVLDSIGEMFKTVDNTTKYSSDVYTGTGKISTPYGDALQEFSDDALNVKSYIDEGGDLYRGGKFGRSNTTDAQFWAPESPYTPGYGDKYGVDFDDLDYIIGGKLKEGQPFITRPAPGLGNNTGGAIEAVTNPNAVKIEFFYMP
jgi:hypothetical protein